MSRLLPNEYVPSVFDISLDDLKARGIKAIITDLDNTLVEWDRPEATEELVDWFAKIKESGFQIVIVSNNQEKRVSKFAEPHGIPFIYSAKKPMVRSFLQAAKKMDRKTEECVVVGDQLFTDVLGGNRAGFYTVLVAPVVESDGFFTKFNRRLERVALAWMKRKGMIEWER